MKIGKVQPRALSALRKICGLRLRSTLHRHRQSFVIAVKHGRLLQALSRFKSKQKLSKTAFNTII